MTDEREGSPLGEVDFFEEYEDVGGIFEDRHNPPGSYGDPDAIEDLRAQSAASPIVMGLAGDGLVAPLPQVSAMDVLLSSAKVSEENMVCLAGPCRHYTEIVIAHEGLSQVIRRCNRVITWAEQLILDDTDMLGCSLHEVDGEVKPSVKEHIARGFNIVRRSNEKAQAITKMTLGVCHETSCQHYAVMVADTGEGGLQTERWCLRLGGAARPYKLDPNQPVMACSAVAPGAPKDALDRSNETLLHERMVRAQRREQPKED